MVLAWTTPTAISYYFQYYNLIKLYKNQGGLNTGVLEHLTTEWVKKEQANKPQQPLKSAPVSWV